MSVFTHPGCIAVDEDAVTPQRRGEDGADGVHAPLRDSVTETVGGHTAREPPSLGGEDDDACPFRGPERSQQTLRQEERSLDVHTQDTAENVPLDLVD
jgi:hypothetical protein